MIILVDEEKIGYEHTCENCNKLAIGRMVEAVGHAIEDSRGWYFVCFECCKPRIKWKSRERSRAYWSTKETKR